MNTVKIEDMPVAEELSSEQMAAVQGGECGGVDCSCPPAPYCPPDQPVFFGLSSGLKGGVTGALGGLPK